ncbi:hypothetical protein N5U55_07760 [Aliarcobacter butzleri]|uniref:hypothetical protein n=1 Tax=Aliarcobacter butzleri TaxID=28197 RepID=UPI0021B42378|nr:hypothetical protein [Aliarcobacter butzleri]MCT7584005.1 hypothetical protein [Aliarcobacter butzleri]
MRIARKESINNLELRKHTMDINIKSFTTLTIFRTNMLKNLVTGPYNLIAAGTPRGGTSILGLLMRVFNFEMGNNVHPDKYEDLDLHQNPIELWGELIKEKIKKTPAWSVKYPAATRHLKLFFNYCPKPIFLIIIRNPFSVTKSMIKHDETYSENLMSYNRGMEIALESYLQFNRYIKDINAPFIVVEHEKISKNPEIFVREFVEVLNVNTDEDTIQKAIKLISTPGYKKVE